MIAGSFYFQTTSHVVLLNHVVGTAYLGPLRARRNVHLEPEADITVVPKDENTTVERFPEPRRGTRYSRR